MRGFLIRLFVVLPLGILWGLLTWTIIIPILWWIISGQGWFDLGDDIHDLQWI